MNTAGLRYTGLAMVSCARSEMIMPLGAGNLQKGERCDFMLNYLCICTDIHFPSRYSNMDYVFTSTTRTLAVAILIVSYDIACQWFINLHNHIASDWPSELQPPKSTKLIPAIPKLHEPMHKKTNHQGFSFNFIPGVGLTNSEAPERIWAPHNSLASATRQQAPGSRQDVLDTHFGFWNWLKYVGQGDTLLRRYKSAVGDRNLQTEAHRGLTDSLDNSLVKKWETMCWEWEKQPQPKTKPNPYEGEATCKLHSFDNVIVLSEFPAISESEVKKTLAQDETARLESGSLALNATSASGFLILGLGLEDMQ